MNNYTIIPSQLQYQGAPSVDQDVDVYLEQKQQLMVEYDRSQLINLAQLYDDERQACTVFRPTFKVSYIYSNTYTGTTNYLPFQYNLYYVSPEDGAQSGVWKGFPQYYEFDFFRPNINDQHLNYKSKSAYTYNWTYYISYPYQNNPNAELYFNLDGSSLTWTASTGIPFTIKNSTFNGSKLISFQCIAPHGLSIGEYVEINFSYNNKNTFQVYSLGNGITGSDFYIFNLFNIGYTGTTFANNRTGTFKRIINVRNSAETKSTYYIRQHKILTNTEDVIITKSGFEKNVFNEEKKFEFSSITPNQISRISQKTSSNAYNITLNKDLDMGGLLDNQKRPVTNIFLTVINKGFTGYFNEPFNNIGLKQGWQFNMSSTPNSWWSLNNVKSNTNIPVLTYSVSQSGTLYNFYYNSDLKVGDIVDGDFCEWNNYEQIERVISPYYHKIKYNQKVFTTSTQNDPNSYGYYYKPHQQMTIRTFSDYIETGNANEVANVPSYAYFSQTDQQFRWRDLYTYGFKDELLIGVDYPFFNNAHYPFENTVFRLIPEGVNYNSNLTGDDSITIKPLFDECE